MGTIPHALISLNWGDTVRTTAEFAKYFPRTNVIALVDFENDCVKTSLEVAKALGKKLWGVRLDTSADVIDKSLQHDKKKVNFGVNPTLVKIVRKALDSKGYKYVKIVVSGGFSEDKIKYFKNEKALVDVYGVGSALVHGSNDFTADVVMVGDKKISKFGRRYRENSRMKVQAAVT